jgi:hypothetical protein
MAPLRLSVFLLDHDGCCMTEYITHRALILMGPVEKMTREYEARSK